MDVFSGIGFEYAGVSGGYMIVILAFLVMLILLYLIPYKQHKYKKEAEKGIFATFHHPRKWKESIMCEVTDDGDWVKYPVKHGRFSRDANPNILYAITPALVETCKYPPGRPNFMQCMAQTGDWTLNLPEMHCFQQDEKPRDTAQLYGAGADQDFARAGAKQAAMNDRMGLSGGLLKVPTAMWVILIAILVVVVVAAIVIVKSGGSV